MGFDSWRFTVDISQRTSRLAIGAMSRYSAGVNDINCRIPSDHIPIRSWPLFLAELMRDLIETAKAEQSAW